MNIYLRHARPFGFKGTGMFIDAKWHQTYYRLFDAAGVMLGIDNLSPRGVWQLKLTPRQVKLYRQNKLSVTPPGCCAPCAGERQVLEVTEWVHNGEIKSAVHLKKILDGTGLFNVQRELEELFQQVTEQRDPALRSRAERELEEVEAALKTYPLVPRDTWIGDNSTDDRVLWLIRRLIGTEAALRELREAAKEIAP